MKKIKTGRIYYKLEEKTNMLIRNLNKRNISWKSFLFRGKGESILNIKWKKNREGFEHLFKTI